MKTSRPWSDQETAEIISLRSQNLTAGEIAEKVGRTKASVDGKFSMMKRSKRAAGPSEPPPGVAPLVEFENAALQAETETLRAELADLRETTSAAGVEAELKTDPVADVEAQWQKAETDSAARIEKKHASSRFKVSFPEPVTAIAFMSDAHIGPGTCCDFKRLRQDAELIRKTPGLRVILAGDLVDNHIKHRSAMIASRSSPSDEYRLVDHLLKMIGAENILLCISGNHDAFTVQLAGVDMLQTIAEQNRVCYAPAEARLTVAMGGGVEYRVAVRHQYRYNSSFNQTHAVKRWWDMGTEGFDIGCLAHHHECAISSFERHGQTLWACRPGAYQVETGYSRQYGFNPAKATTPTFFLFADERRIIGHQDIRDAVLCWDNIKGG